MKVAPPREVSDLGLPQERTLLAWDRTAVAMMITGAFLVSTGGEALPLVFILIGTAAIGVGAWLSVVGYQRYRVVAAAVRAKTPITRPRLVGTLGFTTTLLALATVVRLLVG